MLRDTSTFVRRVQFAAGALALVCLPLGCATIHPADPESEHAGGALSPDAPPAPIAASSYVSTSGPGGRLGSGVSPRPGLLDVDAAVFRRRALAQQRVLRAGAASLPGLADAWAAAPVGSDRAYTLALLLEQVQRKLPKERLAREFSEESGIRRLAAVRAATAHGADMVPALLTLITCRDREVRQAAIVALRSITDRHPSASGRGPVHAIRVWRAWYEDVCRDRLEPTPMPPRRPRPRAVRPPAISPVAM